MTDTPGPYRKYFTELGDSNFSWSATIRLTVEIYILTTSRLLWNSKDALIVQNGSVLIELLTFDLVKLFPSEERLAYALQILNGTNTVISGLMLSSVFTSCYNQIL